MMLRSLIKSGFAGVISLTRPDRSAQLAPLVLAYHRPVERLNASDGWALPAMEISVVMLERHLDWLARRYRIVPPEELGARFEEPQGSQPLAAVTFDDGYSDVFHNAFPLLKRKGIPAGIFVITDLIGTTHLPAHERLHALLVGARRSSTTTATIDVLRELNVDHSIRERAHRVPADPFSITQFLLAYLPQAEIQRVMEYLEKNVEIETTWQRDMQPMSWEMLEEMRDAGMTIGSHTKNHLFLINESRTVALEEARESRQALQQRLGVDASCFAYTGGRFDETVVEVVAAARYRYAFSTCHHRDARYPLLTIPRTGLWEQSCLDAFGRFSPSIMSCQAAGGFRWMSGCRESHTQAPAPGSTSISLRHADSR